MLRTTKKSALAVEAVVDIACHGVVHPVQSRDIAERLDLPRRYLEQVMQQLVRAGILKGVRGPRGGYRLARERRRISVADILQVIDVDEPTEGAEALHSMSPLGRGVMRPFWEALESDIGRRLQAATVEDLCRDAQRIGAGGPLGAPVDFVI